MFRYVAIVFLASLVTAESGCAGTPLQSRQSWQLSGGTTTGPLQISRVELLFQNDRGEIDVPSGSKLSARAVINFNGNGLFQGQWLVDGMPVELVSIPVTFGNRLSLHTAPTTVLPTFDLGPHTVTLTVQSPSTMMTLPSITYHVIQSAGNLP